MQVDGFRFDIMGHLMLSSMKKIQGALGQLSLEGDGVDGGSLYLYGEAWDFGEVAPPACTPSSLCWLLHLLLTSLGTASNQLP